MKRSANFYQVTTCHLNLDVQIRKDDSQDLGDIQGTCLPAFVAKGVRATCVVSVLFHLFICLSLLQGGKKAWKRKMGLTVKTRCEGTPRAKKEIRIVQLSPACKSHILSPSQVSFCFCMHNIS